LFFLNILLCPVLLAEQENGTATLKIKKDASGAPWAREPHTRPNVSPAICYRKKDKSRVDFCGETRAYIKNCSNTRIHPVFMARNLLQKFRCELIPSTSSIPHFCDR
jgi:hypothetical protein